MQKTLKCIFNYINAICEKKEKLLSKPVFHNFIYFSIFLCNINKQIKKMKTVETLDVW